MRQTICHVRKTQGDWPRAAAKCSQWSPLSTPSAAQPFLDGVQHVAVEGDGAAALGQLQLNRAWRPQCAARAAREASRSRAAVR
eukprot:SAG11_NODE_1887_length_4116_cov_8.004730_7_plen_83_part_01